MGLFGFLKRKGPSHAEKVEQAYRGYIPEMAGKMFPGGVKQADKIITSLAKLYGIDLDAADAEQYSAILTTYSDSFIRRVLTQSPNDQIINCLLVKHAALVKDRDVAKKALAFVTLNINNNDFALESNEDMAKLSSYVDILTYQEETAKKNAPAEKANLDDPEYGLVVTKPIYTQGVSGSNSYLRALKAASGESLTWTRCGSTYVEGIEGMIDVYESALPSGKPYKTLFLNMYGSTNSEMIPQGFMRG